MSVGEMIACLGSCRARSEIAAMIKALSLHPWLNTPVETSALRPPARRWRTGSPTATPAKPGTTRTACASATAETDRGTTSPPPRLIPEPSSGSRFQAFPR